MFIGSPYNLKNKVSGNPILINNKLVPRINKYSCLGVTMDERLSWDKHIDSICSKVGAGIGAMYHCRQPKYYNYIMLYCTA